MNHFKKNILLLMLSFTVVAHAAENEDAAKHDVGLFVEPGLTYEFSSATTIDYPGPFVTSDGKVYGLGVMARVGFHVYDALFLAADLRYSRPTLKDTTHSLEASSNSYNFALVAGVQMPLVRVFGSYVFAGGIDPEAYSNSLNMNYTGASGYRIGAGLHVLAVSVNLEYQHINYDTNVETFGPFAVNTSFVNNKLRNGAFVLSATFPLEF